MKEAVHSQEPMMKGSGYSLWLMPTEKTYEKFSGLIKRLAEQYHVPVFEPHVTLLGGMMQSDEEVMQRTERLVRDQSSFPITLRTIDYQDFYFRTLFVRAEEAEPLVALHHRAREAFEMQAIPPYLPHLSLLYGNFSQVVKESIIATIGREHPAEFIANGCPSV